MIPLWLAVTAFAAQDLDPRAEDCLDGKGLVCSELERLASTARERLSQACEDGDPQACVALADLLYPSRVTPPESWEDRTEAPWDDATVIALRDGQLWLGPDSLVALDPSGAVPAPALKGQLLVPLYDALVAAPGVRLAVQADGDTPFSVVRTVFYTAGQAGFSTFGLLDGDRVRASQLPAIGPPEDPLDDPPTTMGELERGGTPILLGALDKGLIEGVIKADMASVQACYQAALNARPDLETQLVIKFVIQGDGTVSSARIKSTEMPDEPLEGCLIGRFEALRFPEPVGGGSVIVSYPFLFESR